MRNSLHGITKETFENLLIDAGKIVLNYGIAGKEKDLGATLGGNTFNVEGEWKDILPDGSRGKIKGGRRLTNIAVTLTVNMFEMTTDNLLLAMPGAEATDVAANGQTGNTHKSIRRSRNIQLEDYLDNIALVGTISGTDEPCIIIVENALQDGALEIATEDKEEATTELTFSGHFNPENQELEPWEIRRPNPPVSA